jgi:hypothetical protein
MYESLKKVCDDFHLYIFAFDKPSYNVLNRLNLPHTTIISLAQFEDEELLEVKPTRNKAEYCWTSTSSTILYVLENFNVDNCTYIDADLYFYQSPKTIFDELRDKSILITEHRYTPQYDKSKKSGKYCVQFITFKKDENGMKALRWWRKRCIEWCYARYEDGKFGDQMYLDDWTSRFDGVHVLQHLGGGVAPWNVQQYSFEMEDEKIIGTEKSTGKKFEVILYHFHYIKFFDNNKIELGRRILTDEVKKIFYKPYINHLEEIKQRIYQLDQSIDPHGSAKYTANWKTLILYIWRKLFSSYNIYDKSKFFRNDPEYFRERN